MATIESLVDRKIQDLKSVNEGSNSGGGGHQNHNNGYNCKACNKNYGNKVCFSDNPDKAPHKLKPLYKGMNNEWKSKKSGSSQITPGNFTQENTKFYISTSHWKNERPGDNIRHNNSKEGQNGMKWLLCDYKDCSCWRQKDNPDVHHMA